MNLLRRIGLGRSLDGLSGLFRRRPSNGLRSVDSIQATAAAAKDARRRWVMLNGAIRCVDDDSAAGAKTMAESRTRTGRQLRVSLGLAPPPWSSFLYYNWVNGAPSHGDEEHCPFISPSVIAAHRDSVLFGLGMDHNYFIYRAGSAMRPPSLSRLLTSDIFLSSGSTSILRRGEDELLVVQLHGTLHWPDLWVLRNGMTEWEIKKAVPIIVNTDTKGGEPVPWQGNSSLKAVTVGDRFLCWVQYYRGVLICDIVDEYPKLRYVQLPVLPPGWKDYYEEGNRPEIEHSRDVLGTRDGALRFASIDLRCCCGGFGMSSCEHSRNAFMVTTWSMNLATKEPLVWVKDTVLHCEELWALPGYEGLPSVHPEFPVMSFHIPDVVYFRISEDNFASLKERKAWVVEVDTRKKVLLSVVPWTIDSQISNFHMPAEL